MCIDLRLAALLMGACLLAPVAGAQAERDFAPIRVGSKNFSESHLLGEIVTRYLAAQPDIEAVHRKGLGGTLICFSALKSGELDVYVEYTGTAWSIVLGEAGRVADSLQVFLRVASACRDEHDLEWTPPLGFANSYAIAVREDQAEELGLNRISDLVPHQDVLRGGFSIEFVERGDGYPGLSVHYGLDLGSVKGLEHSLAYEAIDSGSIDVMDVYTTDGKLARYDLRLLEDDCGFFPPYDAAPVVRAELLRERPEIRTLFERLAFTLTDERMVELNHAVEVEGRDFGVVAEEFLVEAGLLEEVAAVAQGGGKGGFAAFFLGRTGETLRLALEHVRLTGLAVLLATLIAVPLGILATRSRLAERVLLGAAGVVQTVPSLALLAFLVAVPGFGLSLTTAVAALFIYSLLPVLRNTYTGIVEVPADLVDSALGMGLKRDQILVRVQLPLAMRTILAGVRTATVIAVGVATLAAFIGAGGLGEPIVTGLYLNDMRLVLSGALPAAGLALLADSTLAILERRLVPRSV